MRGKGSGPRALLTDMSTPLGIAVGNAIEVAESVEVLAGGGPADVVELTLALAREMVALAGLDVDPGRGAGVRQGDGQLAGDGGRAGRRSGRARCRRPGSARWWWPKRRVSWSSWMRWRWAWPPGGWARDGPERSTTCRQAAGVLCLAKPGEQVRVGQPLFELHTNTPDRFAAALADLDGAIRIAPADSPGQRPALVQDVITAG